MWLGHYDAFGARHSTLCGNAGGETVDEAAYHPGGSSNTPYHFMQLKPFLEKLQLTSLRRGANARNVSFRNSLRWPIYVINSVEKPNYLSLLIKVVLCL